MKLVIQRVNKGVVYVENKEVGKIDKGLLVLVGVKKGDTQKDAEFLADKLAKLRIMSDNKGKMNLSVSDSDASVLVVSQFTLYGNTRKGNRPSFIKAAEPKIAEKLYNIFINELKKRAVIVETGSFGEYMDIDTKLDGPVTILIDSSK